MPIDSSTSVAAEVEHAGGFAVTRARDGDGEISRRNSLSFRKCREGARGLKGMRGELSGVGGTSIEEIAVAAMEEWSLLLPGKAAE